MIYPGIIFLLICTSESIAAYDLIPEDPCFVCNCKADSLDCSSSHLQILPNFNYTTKNYWKIFYNENSLTRITQLKPSGVNYLTFAQNHIWTIDDSAFRYLYNLTTLDLSSNSLTADTLMPDIFRGNYSPDAYEPLRTLTTLILRNNSLHTLHPDIFEHIPNLQFLDLSENRFKIITHSVEIAISSIPSLKVLNLSNIMIKTLPEQFLYTPKYLDVLDLSYNNFSDPPMELESTHSLRWLSLNGNPIHRIKNFPSLPYLNVLHVSGMKTLTEIGNRSLSGLPKLEEFHCTGNDKLRKIDGTAFSALAKSEEEGELWCPLKVLNLNGNKLQYLDSHLVSRWDELTEINLQENPWVCECENQWIVSTLVPMIEASKPKLLTSLRCKEPIEMNGDLLVNLHHRSYQMRCLDLYNHRPERDGKILIGIFAIVLFLTPFAMAVILYLNRLKSITDRNYQKMIYQQQEENL